MFFLLPPKPISDPIVTNFRQSLAQSNENNYHTIPLYNLRGGQPEGGETLMQMQTEPRNDPKLVSKTTMPRKSNVATKSKPAAPVVTSNPAIPSKCRDCGWIYPENMTTEDRDLHIARCRNGYGEEDQMVWMRCKGDRALYRKKFDEILSKTKDKERPEPANKPEKMERERPGKMGAGKKSANKMEVEEDNDVEDKIKIKKKPKAIKETKETKSGIREEAAQAPETKKRKTAAQSQAEEDDIMIKEDLKKIKKNNGEGVNSKVNEIDALSGKVRKSGANKVSLPVASGLVFDPTQAFNKLSGDKK